MRHSLPARRAHAGARSRTPLDTSVAAVLGALVGALALLAAPLAAQQRPSTPGTPPPGPIARALRDAGGADTIPLDPAVRHGVLPNGLQYYVRVNHKPERRAELRLVVDAGSVLEDDDQRGLAHFVEHMAFNGTTHFARNELVNYLESIGMSFGADLNASTSFDETVYQLTVPTDSGGALDKGLLILEDWAHGLRFDHAEIARERGVVTEEWRLGQGAESRIRDKQFPVIFADSRYATRLPIGTKASLDSAKDAELKRFYADWYRPNLMAVVAVGDFDGAAVERKIRERFSSLANPPSPRPRVVYTVPDHDSARVVVATDPEATSTSVVVLWLLPPRPVNTVGAFRRGVVEELYDAMFNRRLAELAQRPDPPFIGAGSDVGRLIRTREAYSIGAAVADTGVERGLETVLREAERVEQFGFTQGELDRARADLLRAYERAYAERDKTNSGALVGEYVEHFLTGEPAPGIAYETQAARALLPTITLANVDSVGRELISDRDRVVLVTAPDKPGVRVPDERALLTVFDRVKRTPVTAWVDSTSSDPLLREAPRAGRVVAERRVPAVGVTEWTLSNGARVIVKPTDFQADQVLLRAFSPGGTSLVADSDFVAGLTAPAVVAAGGVGAFSAITLGKRLAGKAVGVEPSISDDEEGLSGSASPQDLELMLQLTYLYFTAPRADSGAFTALRQQLRAALANRDASPEVAFGDTLQAVLTRHHPRARPFTAARVAEMDLGRSLAVYRRRFADAGDFTFVFVGNVSPDTLRPLVERYLASLPGSSGPAEHARDLGIRPPVGVVERTVRRGSEPKAETAVVFTGPLASFTRPERLAIAALGDVLDIQLRETLREQLGGTYGVQVGVQTERDPSPRYSLSIEFGSAPDRAASLTRALFAQLDTLRTRGPSAATLAKVKEMRLRNRETNLKQNGFWLGQLATYARFGWPLADIPNGDTLVRALDAETVRRAAERYLRKDNYVRVVLVPEK